MEEFSEVLIDVQKEYKRSNKLKDIIIIILIVLMFLQSAFSFGCFVWYESQFEYYDTAQETNKKDVDIETSGDSANAEYNDEAEINIMIMQFTTKVVRIKDGESKYTCNKNKNNNKNKG